VRTINLIIASFQTGSGWTSGRTAVPEGAQGEGVVYLLAVSRAIGFLKVRLQFLLYRQVIMSVTSIQNAWLDEFRIRDLKDSINKLLGEKKHLGGVIGSYRICAKPNL
jgi:hypothetical protein